MASVFASSKAYGAGSATVDFVFEKANDLLFGEKQKAILRSTTRIIELTLKSSDEVVYSKGKGTANGTVFPREIGETADCRLFNYAKQFHGIGRDIAVAHFGIVVEDGS